MDPRDPSPPSQPLANPTADPVGTDGAPPLDVGRVLAALFDFQIAAGADAWLAEDPVDAFALSQASRQAKAPAQTSPQTSLQTSPRSGYQAPHPPTRQTPEGAPVAPHAAPPPVGPLEPTHHAVLPDDEAVGAARALARQAPSLEALREALGQFTGCNLRLTAKSLVFADGSPDARVMFIGEAPGREEDRQGLPFVGRSGQLLDRMLAAIGLAREAVYITNVVPWRPPGNRTPSPQETEICKPFVLRQIELVAPEIVVFLGGASAKALTETSEGILRLRGRWLELPMASGPVKAMATLHPAYLLRNPVQKRFAWRDFLAVKAALAAPGGGPPNG